MLKKYPKLYSKIFRFVINIWPCVRGSGGRITYISEDFRKMTVRLPFNWRTRNAVGTIYGGSMYASTDPMFMLMLMRILGDDYVVWDKGCNIRFKRPAKQTLYINFEISPAMLTDIREKVEKENEITFTWKVDYKDSAGVVYVEFDKILYVAKKDFYKEKLKRKKLT